jgi:gamma-D-glutamyl-L-lysine dipeptidyl-peptidase|tara:strand:+ start:32 stop:796 length:765 start_codon:yes stop_codon:yes gene_type:complete
MEFGISILSVVPIRKEPKDQSEMVSQILFGQHFKILKTNSNWVFIKLSSDNYQGWICSKQYFEITHEDYDNLEINNFPIVSDSISNIINIDSNESTTVTIGATLPYFSKGNFRIRNKKFLYKGEISSKNKIDLIKYAKGFLNTPYLWGGKSILGIDCSGFTQQVYGLSGIKIPRDAYQQAKVGSTIKYEERTSTDLVFFEKNNMIHHVGILISDNLIIHASGQVKIEKFNKDGIIHHKTNKLTHQFHSIKRVIE